MDPDGPAAGDKLDIIHRLPLARVAMVLQRVVDQEREKTEESLQQAEDLRMKIRKLKLEKGIIDAP